jgi:hypothetical protein
VALRKKYFGMRSPCQFYQGIRSRPAKVSSVVRRRPARPRTPDLSDIMAHLADATRGHGVEANYRSETIPNPAVIVKSAVQAVQSRPAADMWRSCAEICRVSQASKVSACVAPFGLTLGARIDPICHQLARILALRACLLQRHVGVCAEIRSFSTPPIRYRKRHRRPPVGVTSMNSPRSSKTL